MNESIKSIIEWHEQTFPNATLEAQIEKFYDEEVEWRTAKRKKHKLEELADMFIVACGIARFNMVKAMNAFTVVDCLCGRLEDLSEYVNKKMKINRRRKWSSNDGKYQHIK